MRGESTSTQDRDISPTEMRSRLARLTSRERQVMQLIVRGSISREMAEQLGPTSSLRSWTNSTTFCWPRTPSLKQKRPPACAAEGPRQQAPHTVRDQLNGSGFGQPLVPVCGHEHLLQSRM